MVADPTLQHAWDVSPDEARQIQHRLREHVVREDDHGPVRLVAGIDIGFEDDGATTRAAVVVLHFPALTLHEYALVRRPTTFPYVPGLLSFREVPASLEALQQLGTPPDLLVCDGHGSAHPLRMGLASHLGLLSGIPSIGVGKSRLVGQHDPVPDERGAWQPLHHAGEVVGAVLRTRARVRPVYVSGGHRVGLHRAIEYALACTPTYRLPETTRQAHRLASGKIAPDQSRAE
jgi:deoxyribonuclease V